MDYNPDTASFTDVLYEYCCGGGIRNGGVTWGGKECFDTVPWSIHALELIIWNIFIIATYFCFDLGSLFRELWDKSDKHCRELKPAPIGRAIDLFLLFMNSLSWLLLVFIYPAIIYF